MKSNNRNKKVNEVSVDVSLKFYHAKDVSQMLDISETSAYRIIKKLNNELSEQGFITIPGKIGMNYFKSRIMM